ncbi:MAG: NB-ARC domain-containing protein, partial [Chloroflexota bacterium]
MSSILLADLLGQYLQSAHTSVNRLAKLSGIPQRTIANWLNGSIKKPHQWQSLVKVALALHLHAAETDELLHAAGHPSISEVHGKIHSKSDKELLSNFHTSPSLSPPFQAIADLPTFVGRISELKNLKHALLDGGRAAICSLRGMGGVGKTSLAAHLAYQLRDQFPDGVLWARLDTSDPLSILGAFAYAYGKDVSQYKDIESRASIVRGLLAEKRVLIVLDNAEASAQVRPLLPPSTGYCAVLITTRHDLSALDGWVRMTLEPFSTESEEALQLFENYLGLGFVHRHRIALLEIAGLVGNLPLALSIIAGHLTDDLSHALGKSGWEESVVTNLLNSLRSSQ